MSKLIQSYSVTKSASEDDSPAIQLLRAEFPELTAALLGSKTIEGTCLLPPCTLMLFVNDGRFGFCLSPKTGTKVAFGTIPDPSKGLSCVESEIAQGNYEWKNSPKRRA